MVKLEIKSIGRETRLMLYLFDDDFTHIFPIQINSWVDGLKEAQGLATFDLFSEIEKNRARKFYIFLTILLMHEILVQRKVKLKEAWQFPDDRTSHQYSPIVMRRVRVPAALEGVQKMVSVSGTLFTDVSLHSNSIWISNSDAAAAFCTDWQRNREGRYYGIVPNPYARFLVDNSDGEY